MTLQVDIPDSLVRQANELADQQKVSVDQVVAAALSAQIAAAPTHPNVAERAGRVNWQRVDAILARVPAKPPLNGDEK